MSGNPQRRMPADWEPLACVWLAWPHNRETWPNRFEPIPAFFADWACLIAESHPVRILLAEDQIEAARATLRNRPGFQESLEVSWVPCATDDAWIRDYGPVFVARQEPQAADDLRGSARIRLAAADFRYNAWGGKYPPWDRDAAAGRCIAEEASTAYESSPLCLEGGAIDTDGQGRLLTTQSALITPNRNPGWTAERIAQELHRRLGIQEIVWLGDEDSSDPLLEGDDTDGHIDQVARFLDPENVVVAQASDVEDKNHAGLENVYRQLRLWAHSTGPIVQVHRLRLPPPRFVDGVRVPESYCNFLRLGPKRLLMPSFRHPESDRRAQQTLQELLPDCQIEPVDCHNLAWGLGTLHCASLHQPLLV